MSSSIGKFDEFARETLKKSLPIVSLPEIKNATLFDYYIDCQHGQFLSWDERPVDKFRQSTPAFVWVPEVISMRIYYYYYYYYYKLCSQLKSQSTVIVG